MADEKDYLKLLITVKNSRAIERVREDAKGYAERATEFLDSFPA